MTKEGPKKNLLSLGKEFKILRTEKRMTIEDTAKELGITPNQAKRLGGILTYKSDNPDSEPAKIPKFIRGHK